MNAVDTNILIYTHDPRDAVKQAAAVALIGTLPDGVLLWQVACEYVAASRKLAAYGHNQTGSLAGASPVAWHVDDCRSLVGCRGTC